MNRIVLLHISKTGDGIIHAVYYCWSINRIKGRGHVCPVWCMTCTAFVSIEWVLNKKIKLSKWPFYFIERRLSPSVQYKNYRQHKNVLLDFKRFIYYTQSFTPLFFYHVLYKKWPQEQHYTIYDNYFKWKWLYRLYTSTDKTHYVKM